MPAAAYLVAALLLICLVAALIVAHRRHEASRDLVAGQLAQTSRPPAGPGRSQPGFEPAGPPAGWSQPGRLPAGSGLPQLEPAGFGLPQLEPAVRREIVRLVAIDRRIAAIALLREAAGITLGEAKAVVDALSARAPDW